MFLGVAWRVLGLLRLHECGVGAGGGVPSFVHGWWGVWLPHGLRGRGRGAGVEVWACCSWAVASRRIASHRGVVSSSGRRNAVLERGRGAALSTGWWVFGCRTGFGFSHSLRRGIRGAGRRKGAGQGEVLSWCVSEALGVVGWDQGDGKGGWGSEWVVG